MGARTDFEPLSWEEAEENRRENFERPASRFESELFVGHGHAGARLLAKRTECPAMAMKGKPAEESLLEQCERLRSELKRGKEYLAQIQHDLAEGRLSLEDWPAYERNCGQNPLAQLTKSVMLNERMEAFLTGWLERRESQLEALSKRASPLSKSGMTTSTSRRRGKIQASLARTPLCGDRD
jgi:hypothetical protein